MTTRKKTWSLLLVAALWGAAGVMAAEPELSLEEAVRIAQDRSHRLAAASQAVALAAGGERVARAEFLPELAATAFWADYDGDVFFARFVNPAAPGTVNPEAPPTDAGSFSTSQVGVLKLSQTLYAGGALASRLAASRTERQLAGQKLRQERLELSYEMAEAYYGVLLTERAVEVARRSVERSQETERAVLRRRAAEEALKVEELGAASHLAYDRHRLLEAENGARFARLALNRLLGRPPAAAYRLSGTLEAPAKAFDEEEAVRRALAQAPAVEEAKLRVVLAETMHRAGRSHFKPKLKLEAFYAWIDNETFFEGSQFGATLSFSIPFAKDVTAGAGEMERAAARRKLESSSLEELLSVLRLQARQAVRETEEAYSGVEVRRHALAYQEEKHRVTVSAFRERFATAEELLGEHTALAGAELELDRALFRARLAEAKLVKVLGGST